MSRDKKKMLFFLGMKHKFYELGEVSQDKIIGKVHPTTQPIRKFFKLKSISHMGYVPTHSQMKSNPYPHECSHIMLTP